MRRHQQLKDNTEVDGESESSRITDIFRTKFSSIDGEEGAYNVDGIIPELGSTDVVPSHDVKCKISKLACGI